MTAKQVNTSRGPGTVWECNQDNGDCLNDKGYPTSVWPQRRGVAPAQRRQRPGASTTAPPAQRNNNDERSNRIERQHSQAMALKYCELSQIDPSDTKKLVELISWFQRDIGRSPAKPQPAAAAPEPAQLGPQDGVVTADDEEVPF
jgi:hypothetical protein